MIEEALGEVWELMKHYGVVRLTIKKHNGIFSIKIEYQDKGKWLEIKK